MAVFNGTSDDDAYFGGGTDDQIFGMAATTR
jgi:hypothetical protein